jgi:putative ABC transport system permease protein
VDAGFNREHLTTFGVVLPAATYPKGADRVAFINRLLDRFREMPGVTGVAAMSGLPPNRPVNANDTDFVGYTPQQGEPAENVDYYQTVTLDYLKTMGIPLIEGRDFALSDTTGAPVVMVNETLAKMFYKNQSPLGRRVKPSGGPQTPWFTIIGVVRDVKQGGVNAKTGSELYFLNAQWPTALQSSPRNMNVVIRTSLGPEVLAPHIRRIVQAMDPALPVINLRSMEDVFADAMSRPRFLAQLLGVFAGLALLLASIGTYGILSYSVSERLREIGIHLALGASRGNVLTMILAQGLRLTGIGLIAGLGGAFLLMRLLRAHLFNVTPSDPATLTGVAAMIGVVALVACYIPASRATRVDPMVVLRDE